MDFICGKTALITGGAKGIGAAIVKRLFEAGMKSCMIADMDNTNGEKLVKEMEGCYGAGKAIYLNTDVTNAEAFECAFKESINKFKKLDVLFNNAGIIGDRIWRKQNEINVNAVVQGSLFAVKYMGRNNGACGGTIVNTASILGLSIIPECPAYNGTKHFVIGFTRSMGTPLWFDATGIRVMAICPGVTKTPLVAGAHEAGGFDVIPGLGEGVAKALASMPAQPPEDIAEAVNTALNEGENGSIWVAVGGKPTFQVAIPSIEDMKKPSCKG